MASRFRNELTVAPPVRIAVRRDGLATTIDWSSERVDRGLGRAHSLGVVGDPRRAGPLPTEKYLIPGTRQDFGGGDITKMTSAGLGSFKELLIATRAREREIRSDVTKAKWQASLTWAVRALAWCTLVPAVSKTFRSKINRSVEVRRSEVETLKKNLESSRISLSFNMETAVAGPHLRMLSAFDVLSSSSRSWALQTLQEIDRVRARSAAGTVVTREALSIGRRADPLIDTSDLPLAIGVQGGHSTAFFYPGFVLIVNKSKKDFALIDLREVSVSFSRSQFTETETVPSDAIMIGKVWAKTNKNGTRDRRFKDNCELPVMAYGEVAIRAKGGVNERLMFSREDSCQQFVSAVHELQRVLRSGSSSRLLGKLNQIEGK